ncbi:hypothetical protein BDW71DRAFT_191555 [Aspergillus fruticulosus]
MYCTTCLKLHKLTYFTRAWGSALTPRSTWVCKNIEGVVDSCVSLALAVFYGMNLSEWLKDGARAPSRNLHRSVWQAFQSLFRARNDSPTLELLHHCSVTSQPDSFGRLTMVVTLDADDRLIFTIRYHCVLNKTARSPRRDSRPYSLPRQTTNLPTAT